MDVNRYTAVYSLKNFPHFQTQIAHLYNVDSLSLQEFIFLCMWWPSDGVNEATMDVIAPCHEAVWFHASSTTHIEYQISHKIYTYIR